MSEAKWTLKPCSAGGAIVDRGVQQIQIVPIEHAHLIASAPALYAALEELLRVDDEWHGAVNSEMAQARSQARAALAQAREEAL